eukprot:SAG22_NODE_10704_length_520_cov_0.921615_2_plen_49_part_01
MNPAWLTFILQTGYGYGDAHVLRDGSVVVAFQKTFDPPVPSIEGGGYDV